MIDPTELFALAGELQSSSECIKRRAAISRAYYAAFHALQDCLLPLVDDDHVGRNGCIHHGAMAPALGRWSSHPDRRKAMSLDAEATQLRHKYRVLLDMREIAEYRRDDASDPDARDVVSAIGYAHRLMAFARKAEA